MSEKMNKQTYFFFIKHFVFVSISLFLIIIISLQEKNKLVKLLAFLFFASIIILAFKVTKKYFKTFFFMFINSSLFFAKYSEILSLPLFPQISKHELNLVIDTIKKLQK